MCLTGNESRSYGHTLILNLHILILHQIFQALSATDCYSYWGWSGALESNCCSCDLLPCLPSRWHDVREVSGCVLHTHTDTQTHGHTDTDTHTHTHTYIYMHRGIGFLLFWNILAVKTRKIIPWKTRWWIVYKGIWTEKQIDVLTNP